MEDTSRVYLDYAATTPVDERVVVAMQPYFAQAFGNPSSIHLYGQKAEIAVDEARQNVAACLNCAPGEVVFTACGTESDNLALRGVAFARRKQSAANHILISPVEHHAVSQTALQLASDFGFDLEYMPVDENGIIDPDDLARRIRKDTALVSVIYANNEIGSINPISEIGAVCRCAGVPLHVDAVQAAAHLPIDVVVDQVDLLSIGAHKFYGPKGVGALYIRKGTPILPMQTGGGQEAGRRAGTQNVPYIVGLAKALQLTREEMAQNSLKMQALRDRLIGKILEDIPDARLTGDLNRRLPNHASFVFAGVDGNLLLTLLDTAGFACSSGSACKTGNPEPSDVLTAIGLPRAWSLGSLRVTLGKATRLEEVDRFLDQLPGLVEHARAVFH
jgi:cysteine desulfurase